MVFGRYAIFRVRSTCSQAKVAISFRRMAVSTAIVTAARSSADSVAINILWSSSSVTLRFQPGGFFGFRTSEVGSALGSAIPQSIVAVLSTRFSRLSSWTTVCGLTTRRRWCEIWRSEPRSDWPGGNFRKLGQASSDVIGPPHDRVYSVEPRCCSAQVNHESVLLQIHCGTRRHFESFRLRSQWPRQGRLFLSRTFSSASDSRVFLSELATDLGRVFGYLP